MKKEITLRERSISYELKRSKRARRLRIAVYCDASVVVTAPSSISFSVIEKYLVDKSYWVLSKIDGFLRIGLVPVRKNTYADFLLHKKEALVLVEQKVHKYNFLYDFSYNKIAIKNQKTRWGSCSTQGNLNFNYKLVFLPERLVDLIVVHELCHLKEPNHSQKFWNLVAQVLPDYKKLTQELKKVTI